MPELNASCSSASNGAQLNRRVRNWMSCLPLVLRDQPTSRPLVHVAIRVLLGQVTMSQCVSCGSVPDSPHIRDSVLCRWRRVSWSLQWRGHPM